MGDRTCARGQHKTKGAGDGAPAVPSTAAGQRGIRCKAQQCSKVVDKPWQLEPGRACRACRAVVQHQPLTVVAAVVKAHMC